jgi:hypothetical protein
MEIYLQLMLTHVLIAFTLGFSLVHELIPSSDLNERVIQWLVVSALSYLPLVSLILIWSI